MIRYTVTGLEKGKKRTLIWFEGELTGDDDLKARFQQAWESTDREDFRNKLPESAQDEEYWPQYLAEEILRHLFEETLDFRRDYLRTPEELQEWADAWNSHGNNTRHYTVEYMKEIEDEDNEREHKGPPFSWDEIEDSLKHQSQFADESDPPEDTPKCLECLQPMEWIYFRSHPWTWQHLCGCAGWTAICRKCKTWRPCRVNLMN